MRIGDLQAPIQAFSTEAGLKYFILGAFPSGLLLFGSSMVYGLTGTTDFSKISALFLTSSPDEVSSLVSIGLVIGVLFIAYGIIV